MQILYKHFPGSQMRGIFHPQGGPWLSAGLTKRFNHFVFLTFLCYMLNFVIKMCSVKFSIELNTFHIDSKDINTNIGKSMS